MRLTAASGLALSGLVSGALAGIIQMPSSAAESVPAGARLVTNSGFEGGHDDWRVHLDGTRAVVRQEGRNGSQGLVLEPRRDGARAKLSQSTGRTGLVAGAQVRTVVWVRAERLTQHVKVLVEERADGERVSRVWQTHRAHDTRWHPIRTTAVTRRADSRLVLRVVVKGMQRGKAVYVDDAALAPSTTPQVPAGAAASRATNGCAVSNRGIPVCSAYLGGAYQLNGDPAPWERQLGRKLGVRRTYFGPDQVSGALSMARNDLSKGRVPWMSFKVPRSWAGMAGGLGDAWLKDLAKRFAQVPGPVWIAFHHEPEHDGDIRQWTAMQERIGPMLRQSAPNVGFSVILTGWNQLYGPSEYRLDALWPDTKVDVVGFDIYNKQGVTKDGQKYDEPTAMLADYFKPISAWAKREGVAWGLAETGYTAEAARRDPRWVLRTYQQLVAQGGVAMAYFNTDAHSIADWRLNTDRKKAQFRFAAKPTPRLR